MSNFTAFLCVEDRWKLKHGGVLGVRKGVCLLFLFLPFPSKTSSLQTMLDCPMHFYCFFISDISPRFPSPQHHWSRAYGLHCVHLEVGRNEQTRKQTLTPKLLSSISCHLYNKKTLIPAWLFIHYCHLKPTRWFQYAGVLTSILLVILFVYSGQPTHPSPWDAKFLVLPGILSDARWKQVLQTNSLTLCVN